MKKILLVDDNKTILNLYQSRLMAERYQVLTAMNGMEAIKLLGSEDPDLVLLDLMIPEMDGFKVLQLIRSNPKNRDLPVIVFSARGEASEIEKAIGLGATAFLIKTTTRPNDLVKRVKELLAEAAVPDETQPPSEKVVPRYFLRPYETAHDAARFAADYGLSPSLTCQKCRSPLVLELEPSGMEKEPLFTVLLRCPSCAT